ncbi:MAG: GTP cyclohydrolase I FolE [Elusimicrobia bacterium]|nr:GTP cyclohydrolase I FolE [Elusimicrobiota bacterium]
MNKRHVSKSATGSAGAPAHDDAIARHVRALLLELGEDPARRGLEKTPQRVAKALREMTSGYRLDLDSLFNGALFPVAYNEMVLVKDIPFYSLCEHHLLPFFGKAHVAYVPDGRIVGLSKIPKLVAALGRKLQVQERVTYEIAETLFARLSPLGVGVVIEARHLCMEMRGAKVPMTPTVTSAMLGCFRKDERTRSEFLSLVRA